MTVVNKPIKKVTFNFTIIGTIIVIMFLSGISIMYPSKYVLDINWQIPSSEINGMNWFLHSKDENIKQTGLYMPFGRFADLLLTKEEINSKSRTDDIRLVDIPDELKLPKHFGYEDNLSLGAVYRHDMYLVLEEASIAFYRDVVPEIAKLRFQPEDFIVIEEDFTVDKIYTSTGFNTYYVHSAQ